MGEELFKPEYLLTLPTYLLVLFSALFLHEMGHYWAARIFGMSIKNLNIGQGRLIKSWRSKSNVHWQFRLLPLGAHVHIEDVEKRIFITKIITILAGPLINFMAVPIFFFVFYCAIGQPSTPNIIVGIEQGLAADQAGLKVGDQITSVNDIPLRHNRDMWNIAYKLKSTENIYTVKRGDNTFEIAIKPDWVEYKDLRGVPRKNARFGIVWQHAPHKLKDITHVNGIKTDGNIDRTRKLLIEHFNQAITINTKSPVDADRPFRVKLNGDINQGLLDEDNDFYKAVYLGTIDGNIYMKASILQNAINAWDHTKTLFVNIAKVPFQLFPIDKAMLRDAAAVSSEDTKIINRVYALLHLFCVASIAIGLINLIPFPKLDGGQCVDQILKKVRGEKLTNKFRANVFASLLLIFYAAIVITNMDNFHGYIDSSLKKVHQFIDQDIKAPETSGKTTSEDTNG